MANDMPKASGWLRIGVSAFLLACSAVPALSQPYVVSWYTVDGGGHGPLIGGAYSLQGTVGQPDASGATTGGVYSILGGYWAGLLPAAPALSSPSATSVAATTATLNATVTSDGGQAITTRGFVFAKNATNPDPLTGGAGVTTVNVAGTLGAYSTGLGPLSPATVYAFKGYATNGVGTSYTVVSAFTTLSLPPGFGNTAPATARALTMNSTTGDMLNTSRTEVWYRVHLFPMRSYQFSAWTVDEDGAPGVSPVAVDLFSDAAGTVPATPAPTTSSVALEGSPNDSPMFAQSTLFQPETNGVYRLRVQGAPAATDTSLRVLARETTLFSPWTSRAAGFEGFIELHNNTSAPLIVTLRAFDNAGLLQGGGLTISVPANATAFRTATDVGIPAGVFAGIVLTHNGTLGAISGNITTLNGANGLSFDSPFSPRGETSMGGPVR